jgi:hypothetical protein
MDKNIESADIPTITGPLKNQLLALRMFQDERPDWGWEDWDALLELWNRESNWKADAQNPRSTARGIPQAMGSLNPETMTDEWMSDPLAQIGWGMDYIQRRYGTPSKALDHHNLKNWY